MMAIKGTNFLYRLDVNSFREGTEADAMMKKTPAQQLGLDKRNGQTKKNEVFLGMTWFLAWVFAISGIGMAIIQFSQAGSTWGREADSYFF